jgi:HD-GYP domain-containing protein (c-di-GMP phosphodiesterase class II)
VGATQAVAAGDFEAPVPVQRADEIGQLAAAFQTMGRAVREREVELKTRVEELELLNALGRNIASTLDLRELARRVVTQCAARFNDFLCSLLLYDDQRSEIVAYAAAGRGAQHITLGERTPLGRGLIGQAALTHRTQVANDAPSHPDFIPLPGVDVRAEVAVPILRDHKVLGVLMVRSDHVKAFQPANVLMLETLAAQLAPAIENAQLFRDLSASYDHTLDALVAALDARDKETEGHSRRVVAYTLALARRMTLSAAELTIIRRGALLHDIGKIGVPDAVLLKPGPLDDAERAIMRRHPEWGERILSGIPFLVGAAEIVCAHQERWDGAGYPHNLKGEAIPLGARIFAVADTFDAMTSDRPYRAARPYALARAEIEAGSGTQFDPRMVEVFLQIPEAEWTRLRAITLTPPAVATTLPLWIELPSLTTTLFELEAFNRLVVAMSGSLDLQKVLHEATRTTVETLGAAASGLFLYDAESDRLSLAADYGLPDPLKAHFASFPVAGFHNEVVVREGRTQLHGSPADVPEFAKLGLAQLKPEWGAYLCVPLKAKGEVLGVMGLFSRRPQPFDDYSLTLYQAIGEQVGLALTNARLYESVQRQALTDSLTGAYNRRYLNDFRIPRWFTSSLS